MAENEPLRRVRRAQEKLGEVARDGIIHTHDARAIYQFALAYRDDHSHLAMYRPPNGHGKDDKQKAYTTVAEYMNRCRHYATVSPKPLLELDEVEVNRLSSLMDTTANTLSNRQGTIRKFYRFHAEYSACEVRPEMILMADPNGDTLDDSAVSPDDMLTRDEIERASNAAKHPRDNALFHTLLFTGMRNTCARTLKWRHIDFRSRRWKPNTDAVGLKNLDRPNEGRPLLGAVGPLARWKRMHPDPDPDAYVFVAKPNWSRVDPYTEIHNSTVAHIMADIKRDAGIEKPMHPHMMRHNFVTICKLGKGLPDDRVKFLIGHSPDSKVMETTYLHIAGEEHAEEVEVAFGYRSEEDTGERPSLTPPTCTNPSCNESLEPEWDVCPNCLTEYDHDAADARRKADDATHETKGDTARAGDEAGESATDKLKKLLAENPELVNELTGGDDDDDDDDAAPPAA